MTAAIDVGLYVGIPAVLLLIGLIAGRLTERRHLRSLAQREALLADVLVTDLRSFPPAAEPSAAATIVIAEAVIATDYLKSFFAAIRNIFGGEVRSYRSLMSRARREAILRLQQQARAHGFDAVCNVRLEMADIGGSAKGKGAAMVAVLASGTAYRIGRDASDDQPFQGPLGGA